MRALTPRQKQIAQLAARGYTYDEMAETLGISRRTARMHLLNIADQLPDTSVKPLRRVRRWMQDEQRGVA